MSVFRSILKALWSHFENALETTSGAWLCYALLSKQFELLHSKLIALKWHCLVNFTFLSGCLDSTRVILDWKCACRRYSVERTSLEVKDWWTPSSPNQFKIFGSLEEQWATNKSSSKFDRQTEIVWNDSKRCEIVHLSATYSTDERPVESSRWRCVELGL